MTPQPIPAGETLRETNLAPPQPPLNRWRHFFSLFKSYWFSRDWLFAWAALIVLIAYQFGSAYIFVASNRWQQDFFNSVEQRQAAQFAPLMFVFLGIVVMRLGTSLIHTYVAMLVGIRWRTELTRRYLDRWMSRNRYAEIERLRLIDNPDQRIADDISLLTTFGSDMLTTLLAFIGIFLTAGSMAVILLETAAPIVIDLGSLHLNIPGSTVWYGVTYALLGSFIMVKIGAPYIRATMRRQHMEADFRTNLIHVRRNAEQIGIAGAVRTERRSLGQSFEQIRQNYRSVIYSTLGINAGQGLYEQIMTVLPLFLLIPRYFAGAITFGAVMGARDAFTQLVGQLSFFIQGYSRIGVLIACLNRLKTLDDALDIERPKAIKITDVAEENTTMAASGLKVAKPTGAPLLDVGDWTVRTGERWVVRGPSGAGKSTLLRAILGLWPEGAGSVALDHSRAIMVVPQRLYLPLGTLKGAVCFPDTAEQHSDAEIVALLCRVGLADHGDDIHHVRFWQETLSPGEQQRVALARVLLHKPGFLVLDEATSALDPQNAAKFYEELITTLPQATVISVVHDDRLEAYHTNILTIEEGRARSTAI